jgi:hypothetical protein
MSDIIQISEEQAHKMIMNTSIIRTPNSDAAGISTAMTLDIWKEKGYIKEEIKDCPFCGCRGMKMPDTKNVKCSNYNCFLSYIFIPEKEWDKRA